MPLSACHDMSIVCGLHRQTVLIACCIKSDRSQLGFRLRKTFYHTPLNIVWLKLFSFRPVFAHSTSIVHKAHLLCIAEVFSYKYFTIPRNIVLNRLFFHSRLQKWIILRLKSYCLFSFYSDSIFLLYDYYAKMTTMYLPL